MKKKPAKKPAAKKPEFLAKNKKSNPLNKAIMEGKPLKSKNKKPGRYLDK